MSMFSPDKGFIYLVFAQEDEYYLKSLACLNMNQFLFYKLKQEYDGIYFVSGNREEIQLVIPDSISCMIYDEVKKKAILDFFTKRIKGVTEPDRQIQVLPGQMEDFKIRLFQILRKKKKQALVFTAEAFYELFDQPDYINELCELQNRCLGKNIILIQTVPALVGNIKYLKDSTSVFHSELFSYFSCEGTDKRDKIFQRLKELMGGCCTYLNKLNLNEIKWMVRRVLLEQSGTGQGKPSLADDYADFIYCWYHSPRLRQIAEGILPENQRHLMLEIRKMITRPGVFDDIEKWIRYFRKTEDENKELKTIIQKKYCIQEEEDYIYMDSPLIHKLDSVIIPENIDNVYIEKFTSVMRELRIPKGAQDEIEKDGHLGFCAEQLKQAGNRGDRQSFEKIIDALEFEILSNLDVERDMENIRKIYHGIINISQYQWLLENGVRENAEEIRKMKEELKRINQEIMEFKKVRLAREEFSVQKAVSGDAIYCSARQKEALDLNENIQDRERQNSLTQTQLISYKNHMQKMEQTVQQLKMGNLSSKDKITSIVAVEQLEERLHGCIEEFQRSSVKSLILN